MLGDYEEPKESDIRPSIVSFIDVLGYSKLVGSSDEMAMNLLNAILHSIKDTRDRVRKLQSDRAPGKKLSVRSFSDNIVISSGYAPEPKDEREAKDNLWSILNVLLVEADIQTKYIADHDLLSRGGAATGKYYKNRDIVFGTGLINAYKLESGAETPRIAVSDDLYNTLMTSTDMARTVVDSDFFEEDGLFLKDGDGQRYVNYLFAELAFENMLKKEQCSQEKIEARLEEHRLGLERAIEKSRDDIGNIPKIWRKYRWAVDYHNRSVDLMECGTPFDESKLPECPPDPKKET